MPDGDRDGVQQQVGRVLFGVQKSAGIMEMFSGKNLIVYSYISRMNKGKARFCLGCWG